MLFIMLNVCLSVGCTANQSGISYCPVHFISDIGLTVASFLHTALAVEARGLLAEAG